MVFVDQVMQIDIAFFPTAEMHWCSRELTALACGVHVAREAIGSGPVQF